MFVDNITYFENVKLHKVDKDSHYDLVKHGFSPVYIDDDCNYYYVINDDLLSYMKI